MTIEAPKDEVPCTTCGELIPAAARKCSKCGSYQDWRRYFSIGTTALALLTALVSVVATSVPIVSSALAQNNSHLTFFVAGATPSNLIVLATNSGDRPGAVLGGTLTYNREAIPQQFSFSAPVDEGFVEAGKGAKVLMAPSADDYPGLQDNWFDVELGSCTFTINTVEFDGSTRTEDKSLDCRTMLPIVLQFAPKAVKPYV